ncbi:MAG TPA: hypothetical protein VMV94_07920, partial [Phycisphaerae bacterium]|nr:hypothetical protein [Phycisphaerae bacterium]
MRIPHGVALAMTAALAVSATARAQLQLNQPRSSPTVQTDAFLNNQRALERENEQKLQRELPAAQKFRLDYGGWYNSYFFLFDDGIKSSRTLRENELRLWTSFSADQGVHEGYARMRMTYDDWNHGDNYTAHENDLDGPNLERG